MSADNNKYQSNLSKSLQKRKDKRLYEREHSTSSSSSHLSQLSAYKEYERNRLAWGKSLSDDEASKSGKTLNGQEAQLSLNEESKHDNDDCQVFAVNTLDLSDRKFTNQWENYSNTDFRNVTDLNVSYNTEDRFKITLPLVEIANRFPNLEKLNLVLNSLCYFRKNLYPNLLFPNVTALSLHEKDLPTSKSDMKDFLNIFPKLKTIDVTFGFADRDGHMKRAKLDTLISILQEKGEIDLKHNLDEIEEQYKNGGGKVAHPTRKGCILLWISVIGLSVMGGVEAGIGHINCVGNSSLDKLTSTEKGFLISFGLLLVLLIATFAMKKSYTAFNRGGRYTLLGFGGMLVVFSGLGATLGSISNIPAIESIHCLNQLNSMELGAVYGAALLVGLFILKTVSNKCCCSFRSNPSEDDREKLVNHM